MQGNGFMQESGLMQNAVSIAILLTLAAVGFGGAKLGATPIEVINHSFEDISGESPFNEFTFGALNGWGVYDPNVVTSDGDGPTYFVGTLTPFEPDPVGNPGVFANFPGGAADGQRVAIAFNFQGSDGQGEYGLMQLLAITLQPYSTYTLEVEIGNIDSATAMNGDFFPLAGFPGYRVDLLAGDFIVAQDDNSLAGTIPDGEFATSTVTLTTGANHDHLNQLLQIRLVNLNQLDPLFPDSDIEVDFDNVRFDRSPAVAGDYNFDGRVDAADYTLWRDTLGSTIALDADGDRSGIIDAEDYAIWRANFGGQFLANLSGSPVPEFPSGVALMLAIASLGAMRGSWQTSGRLRSR